MGEAPAVQIHVLPSGPIQTNGYLLTEAASGTAVLVDAPGGILAKVEPILAREGCRLVELWLTHGHWDHMQDGAAVKRATGARVCAHEGDRRLIETPQIQLPFTLDGITLEPVAVDTWVGQGDVLRVLGREFEVRHVPGHAPGNVLFYLPAVPGGSPAQPLALVGDALFNSGVGRWDLPGGDYDVLARAIREQIYTLPDDTVVLPGHGEPTLVGVEKETNPYVAAVVR